MSAKEDKELAAMQAAHEVLKDLQPEEQRRVLEWLGKKLKIIVPVFDSNPQNPAAHLQNPNPPGSPPLIPTTPKDFMTTKRPTNGIERVTCLAYILTHSRQVKQFKTRDLTKLNTEASQPKLSNPAYFSRDAANAQYLSLAGGGKKQITARGEAVVAALPDRAAVAKALEAHPIVGRKSKLVKKPKSKKS